MYANPSQPRFPEYAAYEPRPSAANDYRWSHAPLPAGTMRTAWQGATRSLFSDAADTAPSEASAAHAWFAVMLVAAALLLVIVTR